MTASAHVRIFHKHTLPGIGRVAAKFEVPGHHPRVQAEVMPAQFVFTAASEILAYSDIGGVCPPVELASVGPPSVHYVSCDAPAFPQADLQTDVGRECRIISGIGLAQKGSGRHLSAFRRDCGCGQGFCSVGEGIHIQYRHQYCRQAKSDFYFTNPFHNFENAAKMLHPERSDVVRCGVFRGK